ncbi:MAG: nucleotidyltransferase family protein [Anaerolineaceae bacterium]|jgi:hypothetical protein
MIDQCNDINNSIRDELRRQEKFFLICRLLRTTQTETAVTEEFYNYSDHDWEEFWKVSRIHSVTELLYSRIMALNIVRQFPDNVLERFREFLYPRASANSWLLQTGNDVTQKLFENGIETIALKGFFLQQVVYADGEIRPMNDIDLLVRREQIPDAIEILDESGFRVLSHFDPTFENEDIKHVPPMQNEYGQTLELHWNLLEENEPFSIDMDCVWDQKCCFDDQLWGLSVEHLIVHLAIHGSYQHYLRLGLRSLLDLNRVIEKFADEIEWEQVLSTAKTWNAEKSLWISLKLTQKYLSLDLPEDVVLSLEPENGGEMFDRACLMTETLKPLQTVLSPDLMELSKDKNVGSRLSRIIKRIFIPKRQLARLYNIDPQSLRIYPAYFRRIRDLSKQYQKTLNKIKTQSDSIQNDVNQYEEQIAIHNWLGLND